MYSKILIISLIIPAIVIFSSCTKEVPKELLNNQKQQQNQQNNQQQMPDDSIHRNLSQNQNSDPKGDLKADEMMKAADDAESKYLGSKSEIDKTAYIEKQMGAANYLMFEANVSPKKKYKPALQRYNKVLEVDPKNSEAMKNKKQIEEIYQSMGMPIPN